MNDSLLRALDCIAYAALGCLAYLMLRALEAL